LNIWEQISGENIWEHDAEEWTLCLIWFSYCGLVSSAFAGHKLQLLLAVLFTVQTEAIFGCGKWSRRCSADFCTFRFYFQCP
jgi:hypothetical protein